MAMIEQSYEGLQTLLVKEQYIATCPKPLELFLRKRAVVDLETLAKLAEQYEDAHAVKLRAQRESNPPNSKPRSRMFRHLLRLSKLVDPKLIASVILVERWATLLRTVSTNRKQQQ